MFATDPLARLRKILLGGGRVGSPDVGSNLFSAGAGFYAPQGKATSNPVGNTGSDLDKLFQQLMQSAGGGSYSIPSNAALDLQARTDANMAYDPQISAARRAMAQAKTNTAYSKTAVGKLFQGLAGSYETDKKATKQLFKEAKEDERARLTDYTNTIKDNYADSMNSLAETYKKLGIEAAAGESTTGRLAEDQAFNLQQETTKSSAEESALGQEQTGEMEYWQRGAGTAKLEGTQRQGDLQMALNQYLNEQSGRVADLEAQRQLAYQNALAKLQQNVAEQAAKQSQQSWSNMMELARLQQSRQSAASAKAAKGFGKGLQGANNYLYEQFVNSQWGPSEAERYSGILQGLILQLPPGMSAEQAAQYAAGEANRRGISPTVMARAMLAYQGRL